MICDDWSKFIKLCVFGVDITLVIAGNNEQEIGSKNGSGNREIASGRGGSPE
jgi:hypothetical protein